MKEKKEKEIKRRGGRSRKGEERGMREKERNEFRVRLV